jgi:asparagine synthase (glutamine-hydrolysing)
MKEKDYIDNLIFLLKNEIKKLNKNESYALAFSGGLDSCVLAKLILNERLKVKGYVVGIKNCQDITYAKRFSKKIGLKLKVIQISEIEIKRAIKIQKEILGKTANPDSISFNLPLYFVARRCKEKKIICGQGADELFLGYKKYLKLNKNNLKRLANRDFNNLIKIGKKENEKTVRYFKKKIIFPYLYRETVFFSKKIPYNFKIREKLRKYILRKVSEKLKLGKKISYREKKAAQYGSGIIWIMKKFAKKKKVHISRYIRELK